MDHWNDTYYYVYILASKKNGTLYIGVTNNLIQRVLEHRLNVKDGFAEKYNVKILVYYESYQYVDTAIACEKQLKKWNRDWKIQLIEKLNNNWRDLLEEISTKEQIEYVTDMIKGNKDFYGEVDSR